MTAFSALCAGVLGAAVGSFLTVVVDRVPAGRSIVRPRSACTACGTVLTARDNVPVLSFLVLRGHCRHCGSEISLRYPVLEVVTATLWAAAVLRFGVSERAALVASAGSVLIALAAIDLATRRLPNVIVLPATVVAVLWSAGVSVATSVPMIVLRSLASGAALFAVMLILALVSGGMGMGDVKLAGFVGVVAGRFAWEVALLALFASFLTGGAMAVLLLLLGRAGRKSKIPFGPAISVGAIAALFAGPAPVRAWLGV